MLELLNLPGHVRRRPDCLILWGITVGGKSPKDMQAVLRVLVADLTRAWTDGVGLCIGGNEFATLRVMLTRAYGDGPAAAKMWERFGPGGACGCLRCRKLCARLDGRPHWGGALDFLSPTSSHRTPSTPAPPLLKTAKFVAEVTDFIEKETDAAFKGALKARNGIHGRCAFAELPYAARTGLLGHAKADLMHAAAGFSKVVKHGLEDMYPEAYENIASRMRTCLLPSSVSAACISTMANLGGIPTCDSFDWVLLLTLPILPIALLENVPPAYYDLFTEVHMCMRGICSSVVGNAAWLDELEERVILMVDKWSRLMPSKVRSLCPFVPEPNALSYAVRRLVSGAPPSSFCTGVGSVGGTKLMLSLRHRSTTCGTTARCWRRGCSRSRITTAWPNAETIAVLVSELVWALALYVRSSRSPTPPCPPPPPHGPPYSCSLPLLCQRRRGPP